MANFDDELKLPWNFLLDIASIRKPMNKKAPWQKKTGYMPKNEEGHFTTVDGVPVRKLFVANLEDGTEEKDLNCVFQRYGRLVEVSVIHSHVNGKANFGFVTYETPAEASEVLRIKHKLFLYGRKVYVSPADSWHQPLELPNGRIIWDRRKEVDDTPEDHDHNMPECSYNSSFGIDQVVDHKECPISKLNDDCLLLIFDCLPLSKRLDINKVCERWRALNNIMWQGLRKLDFTSAPFSDKPLNDELLQSYVKVCPNLTHINIAQDDHKLTSNAIVDIGRYCHDLEEITIREVVMQKRSLAYLARNCPKLKAFYMDACSSQHDGEMVALVRRCRNLESLGMKYSSSPSGHWLRFIQCPLKSLSLEMYEFNPDFLQKGIHNVRHTLKELKFVSCDSIRDRDVQFIGATVPGLTSLTLAGGFPEFEHRSLMPLTKMTNLIRLDLDNNAYVCDHFLSELAEHCKELQYFSLSGIDDRNVTQQGLSVISQFSDLTHLTLACVRPLSDSNLKAISQKLKNLKHLDLMGCNSITDEGCQSIVSNCTDLEILDVSGCANVTNQTVTVAVEKTKGGKRKLKIVAGESGIDLDICWPPSVIIDPHSSIMSNYPNAAMFLLDPEFDEHGQFYNNLDFEEDFDDEDDDDLYDDDDSIYDVNPYGCIHFRCNDSLSSDDDFGDYIGMAYFD